MLKSVTVNTEAAARVVEAAAGQVEGLVSRARGLAATITALGASYLTLNELRRSWEAFADRQAQMIQFTATIRGHGHDVEALTAQYAAFAKELSAASQVGRRDVLGLLQMAEGQFRITSTSAERAVKDAVHLAAVTGSSAQAMMRVTSMVAKGDNESAMRFGRRMLGMRDVKNVGEFMAEYKKKLASGTQASEELAGTTRVQLAKLRGEYQLLLVKIGELVDGPIKKFVVWLKEVVVAVEDWMDRNKSMPTILGDIKAGFDDAVEGLKGMWDWVGRNSDVVVQFVKDNQRLFEYLGLVAGAVLAGVVAYKLAAVAVGLLSLAYTALHVEQVLSLLASAAVWLIYNGAVLAAAVALGVYNGVVWVLNATYAVLDFSIGAVTALIGLMSVATVADIAATLAATVATWGWNAALYVMDTLLGVSGFAILALVGTVVVLTGALFVLVNVGVGVFAGIASAAVSAAAALDKLMGAFEGLADSAKGPLGEVNRLLNQTVGIVKDVAHAATVNLDHAWKMAKAGAALMVSEVRDLWPPLWDYLQTVGQAAWTLIRGFAAAEMSKLWPDFKYQFVSAVSNLDDDLKTLFQAMAKGLMHAFADAIVWIGRQLIDLFSAAAVGPAGLAMKAAVSGLRAAIGETAKQDADAQIQAAKDVEAQKTTIIQRLAKAKVAADAAAAKDETDALVKFKAAAAKAAEGFKVTPSDRTVKLRDDYEKLKEQLKELEKQNNKAGGAGKKANDDTERSAEKAKKAQEHLTHALAGTAEEARRMEHQRAVFEAANESKRAGAREDKVGNASAAGTAESNRKIEANTNQMADHLREMNERGRAKDSGNKVEIGEANLGDWF